MSDLPSIGDKAPLFTAIAVGGPYAEETEVALSDFLGKPVVLYFYPKDDTPGCTVQACAIRDEWSTIQSRAVLFGVSIDSPSSHRKFIDKHGLPFPLLSDESKSIVAAYHVWVEKSMYGKSYMGTERSTFVIDPEGVMKGILRKVKPEEHLGKVLEILDA